MLLHYFCFFTRLSSPVFGPRMLLWKVCGWSDCWPFLSWGRRISTWTTLAERLAPGAFLRDTSLYCKRVKTQNMLIKAWFMVWKQFLNAWRYTVTQTAVQKVQATTGQYKNQEGEIKMSRWMYFGANVKIKTSKTAKNTVRLQEEKGKEKLSISSRVSSLQS